MTSVSLFLVHVPVSLYASMDSQFKERYETILNSLSKQGKNGKCQIWCGPVNGAYGRIKITVQPKVYKSVYAHRLSFFIAKNLPETDFLKVDQSSECISHLCHNPLCINPDHLSSEPSAINNQRQNCRFREICDGHEGYPACRLELSNQWCGFFFSLL